MHRREFLAGTAAALTTMATRLTPAAAPKRRIVLRSSWQTVNIGDIAHTPGVLALLEKFLPDVEVRLWPSRIDNGVEELLLQRFPKLQIVQGTDAIKQAFAECDFLLHGSGPSLVAANDVERWQKATGKPYGVYGITNSAKDDRIKKLLSDAQFVFFRDSVSLKAAQAAGVNSPIMEFGPDGAFAVDLKNDAAADKFLADHQLEPGKFLCCIGRLRKTPYWKIHGKTMTAADQVAHERNEKLKDHDHAQLRAAITTIVRETDLKVLVCPEDQSQMAVGQENIVAPLPDDVKKKVVWRPNYWLTDEAISTYRRSAGLFGNEMHSPIMCVGNGIPALVCRWAEQTSKGYMWQDIGLGDWLFNMDDEESVAQVALAIVKLAKDLPAARDKTAKARAFVAQRQQATMKILADTLAKLG